MSFAIDPMDHAGVGDHFGAEPARWRSASRADGFAFGMTWSERPMSLLVAYDLLDVSIAEATRSD